MISFCVILSRDIQMQLCVCGSVVQILEINVEILNNFRQCLNMRFLQASRNVLHCFFLVNFK